MVEGAKGTHREPQRAIIVECEDFAPPHARGRRRRLVEEMQAWRDRWAKEPPHKDKDGRKRLCDVSRVCNRLGVRHTDGTVDEERQTGGRVACVTKVVVV